MKQTPCHSLRALALLLWLCTAQIYACLRFIQEWAHPFTLVNYTLVGLSSGTVLACAMASACFRWRVRMSRISRLRSCSRMIKLGSILFFFPFRSKILRELRNDKKMHNRGNTHDVKPETL